MGFPSHWECVGFSDVDKYASAIYRHQFPKHRELGDVRKISTEALPEFDLLCGGFPCQSFSIAGKRRGFKDTRGTLFFEIVRILNDKKPRYFLLENVRGLLSSQSGKTFQTIIGILSELGYFVQWGVYNSKNHGVPQSRPRIFIAGYSTKPGGRKIFLKRVARVFSIIKCKKKQMETETANILTAQHGQIQGRGETYIIQELQNSKGNSQSERIFHATGISCCLRSQGGNGGQTGYYKIGERVRTLTPIECERLQGFPDDWTRLGNFNGEIKEISNTQRYKCLGNAVTTNVVKFITEGL